MGVKGDKYVCMSNDKHDRNGINIIGSVIRWNSV